MSGKDQPNKGNSNSHVSKWRCNDDKKLRLGVSSQSNKTETYFVSKILPQRTLLGGVIKPTLPKNKKKRVEEKTNTLSEASAKIMQIIYQDQEEKLRKIDKEDWDAYFMDDNFKVRCSVLLPFVSHSNQIVMPIAVIQPYRSILVHAPAQWNMLNDNLWCCVSI